MTKVLALGFFDLFHIGHLNYLKNAKLQGDYLIVGVAPDCFALASKQKVVTVPLDERIEIIKALKVVDDAVIVATPIANTQEVAEWIKSLGVHIVASGDEWQNSQKWIDLKKVLNGYDIKVIFVPTTKGISSTLIRQRIYSSTTS